jgi:hypothetical protein
VLGGSISSYTSCFEIYYDHLARLVIRSAANPAKKPLFNDQCTSSSTFSIDIAKFC